MQEQESVDMLRAERLNFILEKVGKDGKVTTNEIVAELGLTKDTIRKDFQELSNKELVIRFHGGIQRLENTAIAFDERVGKNEAAKERLAKATVKIVENKRVIYIDGGTTNLKFVQNLPKEYSGLVITNSPMIAIELCNYPNVEITQVGGSLDKVSKVVEGAEVVQQLQKMNLECSILGVSSISPEHGVTYPTKDEAILKKAVIEQSQQVIVMATKDKLGLIGAFYSEDISSIHTLLTDETNEKVLSKFARSGIQVMTVPEDD